MKLLAIKSSSKIQKIEATVNSFGFIAASALTVSGCVLIDFESVSAGRTSSSWIMLILYSYTDRAKWRESRIVLTCLDVAKLVLTDSDLP